MFDFLQQEFVSSIRDMDSREKGLTHSIQNIVLRTSKFREAGIGLVRINFTLIEIYVGFSTQTHPTITRKKMRIASTKQKTVCLFVATAVSNETPNFTPQHHEVSDYSSPLHAIPESNLFIIYKE